MKRKVLYLTYLLIVMSGFVSVVFAQAEEDSLVTEIDSLLNMDVAEEQFISSASKYDQSLKHHIHWVESHPAKNSQA